MKTPLMAPLRTMEERDRLVLQYLPLVKHVVARMPVSMPSTLNRDDFHSVGVMGLIHAATAYDPTRGASFKTFAYTAIRGAVLDEIRKHDPVPRSRRDRLRNLERAAGRLRTELNRQPTVEEIAESMGTSAESLDSDLLALHTCRILSLDEFSSSGNGELLDFRLGSVHEDTISPSEKAITKEQVGRLAKAISELPESERNVIVLYHYENLYLKEIGEILGVSESRISQVLSRATARLRMKMKEE